MCFCLVHTHVFNASPSLVMVLGKFPIIKNKETDKENKYINKAVQQISRDRQSAQCYVFASIRSPRSLTRAESRAAGNAAALTLGATL